MKRGYVFLAALVCAVIYATGQQEQWDGYIYHWSCVVYESDKETAIGFTDVRGFTGNYGPGIIAAPDLDPGIYYVRMTATGSGNPFMTTFTTQPYELELGRYYLGGICDFKYR